MNQDSDKRIELRSEKVRRIIGTVPPVLVRWNIIVLLVIVCTLLVIVYSVAYKPISSRKKRKSQRKCLLL